MDFLAIPFEDLSLGDTLGEGGCGVVYRGRWLSRHEEVAVKRLHPRSTMSEAGQLQFQRDFMKELRVLYHLKGSPGIVSMWGACVENGRESIVMEFCNNGSLFKCAAPARTHCRARRTYSTSAPF